jgi:hypothetical protein
MNLFLPAPDGLDPKTDAALDQVIAPLQVWAGKVDGFGKWVDDTIDSTILRVTGVGNTWTPGGMVTSTATYSYTLIGNTMLLSFFLFNTALTITTAVNSVYLKIPGGRRASIAPKSQQYTRSVVNPGWANVGGTPEMLYLTVSDQDWIGIARSSFANWATVATLTVAGQIAFEVAE